MKLNKAKVISSLLLSFVMVVTQVPAYALSTGTEYNETSMIHSFQPSIIENEIVRTNTRLGTQPANHFESKTATQNVNQNDIQNDTQPQNQLKVVSTSDPLTASENDRVLVDVLNDSSNQPISISSEAINSFEMSSEGEIEVVYTLNGKQGVATYLEKDILRHLNASDFENDIAYRPADEVAEVLGLTRLKEAVQDNGQEIIVAVVDTGIDQDHPIFKDRLVQGYDVLEDDHTVTDDDGHGTHVAGIIALSTSDNVKIMPIDVFGEDGALDSSVVSGIYYAVKNGAKVINLSLGGYGKTSYLEKGIQYARNNGVIVIAAAGNDAHDVKHDYPAAFKEVITVGATNNTGSLLYYSNFGDAVDICAPGEKIVSAFPDESAEALSGTSMASPFVAATAAMLWLDHKGMKLADVENLLLANTKDLGAKGKDIAFGNGEINYENYKSNDEFYLIGYTETTSNMEFKYDMPLNYYVGSKVKSVEFLVDDSSVYTSTNKNGIYSAPINIRSKSVGAHTLKVKVTLSDGTQMTAFEHSFNIPKYNVRIKLYDLYGDNRSSDSSVRDSIDSLIYNYTAGIYAEESGFIFGGGTINRNIDFSSEADKKLYHYFIFNHNLEMMPLYFRGLYTGGDYLIEPTECQKTEFVMDSPYMGSYYCSVDLPLSTFRYNDMSIVRWDYYDFSEVAYTELYELDKEGEDKYLEAIYHDQADFGVNIKFEQVIERLDEPWNSIDSFAIYSDSITQLQSDQIISSDNLSYFKYDHDEKALFSSLSLYDYQKKKLKDYYKFSMDFDGVLPKGFYNVRGTTIYELNNKDRVIYRYRNDINSHEDTNFTIKLENELKDMVWSNIDNDNTFHHTWTDDRGNIVEMLLEETNGKVNYMIPSMILINTKTGNKITLTGRQSGVNPQGLDIYTTTHNYDLSKVPNGSYEVVFELEEQYEIIPIEKSFLVIEVYNGKLVANNNTAPRSLEDVTISIMPHQTIAIDMSELFWDSEQSVLEYTFGKGFLVDNVFYYQDLLGKDAYIPIMALDGMGGRADCKLRIKIGDGFQLTNDFKPIQDVILMGTSPWAKESIAQAINDKLVNNDLLEDYQNNITRAEVCELVVKMIESKRGKVTVMKGVNFKDTTDEAVFKAASLGVMSGSGNGEFNPYGEITRQQYCSVMLKVAQKLSNQSFNLASANLKFKDWNQVEKWAIQGTVFCVNNGIISGTNGLLSPSNSVTKEQAITMIMKLWNGDKNGILK
ncbi:S8 family serine peptidase [Fusibacter bizertensis]|uniref:S8 family serine peptidase n=1 Tax=Fusibacter bizertensis TaxID=1488331 RepID=A0ABT6NHJ7_9FIRM|nr:S8 family serine peptidase [Fusibacter bizertensis]MDH8679904.1 S8 family serine peptidase [Fusibacter bizertensis]